MGLEAEALGAVVDALNRGSIPYQIGGSYASSAWGKARFTHDLDIAVMMTAADVAAFVSALGPDFVASTQELISAIESREPYRMGQLIHVPSMLKFDLFIVTEGDYTRSAFDRSHTVQDVFGPVQVASAETIIIEKLRWFELGGRVSDRQWNDIVQVLEVQAGRLDLDYLDRWAKHFGVSELLELAIEQADPYGA